MVARINSFIEGLNTALALLPDWATGEGGLKIGTLEAVDLGGITNPFEGAASAAGTAAADAFRAAMSTTYIEAPDLFGGMAEAARGRAAGYGEAAGMLSEAAARPMTAWETLKAAITGAGTEGENALNGAAAAAGALSDGFEDAGQAAGGAGDAAKKAAEEAATGWAQVTKSLADYAKGAMDWGKGLGETLTSAFSSAESAFRQFVTTGKFDFKSLVSSILADLATLAFKNAVLGPLASALSGVFGGGIFGGGAAAAANPMVNASIWHTGGMVGAGAPMRAVPITAFADAPRLHSGVATGQTHDQRGDGFGHPVIEGGVIGMQHLGRTVELRSLGCSSGRGAGDEDMDLAQCLHRAQRLGHRIGRQLPVIHIGKQKNGHLISVPRDPG